MKHSDLTITSIRDGKEDKGGTRLKKERETEREERGKRVNPMREGGGRRKETGALMEKGGGDFKGCRQSQASVSSSTRPGPRKIDKDTIARLSTQVLLA